MIYKKGLLTGATGGLGEALATLLYKKGIPLILVGRDREKLSILQKKIPGSEIVVEDFAKSRSQVLETIEKEKPDLVINNAGFGHYARAIDTELQTQVDIFDVNAKAVLEITLAAAKTLIHEKRRGTILNVSSIASDLVSPLLNVYAASKAFVTQFSKATDYECKKSGIRVLVSLPGQIETPFASKAAHKEVLHEKNMAIPVDKMAERIMWQIEKQKGVDRFDNRYALLSFVSRHFVSDKLIAKVIEESILKRLL